MLSRAPGSELPANLYDGLQCYMGHSTRVSTEEASSELYGASGDGSEIMDECGSAPLYVNLYLVFNLTYNILMIVILKYGSANILYLGSTALVPLTNVAFALPMMPGHKPTKPSDVVGLFVIMTGIFLYRFVGYVT